MPNITDVDEDAGSIGSPVPPQAEFIGAMDPSGNLKALTTDANGKLNIAGALSGFSYSSYSPDPASFPTSNQTSLSIDAVGRLETHSTTTSDEGSFRHDFSGTGFTTALTGTLTFTNGSYTVTGTGTFFTSQVKQYVFIKKSTDADTLYCQVDAISNDTVLFLDTPYAGTTATVAAVISTWLPTTGTGGSMAIANSAISINSGTAISSSYIFRAGDYLPYTCNLYFSISQRIANQTIKIGLMDAFTGTAVGAYLTFTGTTNTTGNLVTQSSSAATDTQTTAFTLPGGATTATLNTYKIDLSGNYCTLSINGTIVAQNQIHLPGPYDNVNLIAGVTNAAVVTTTALVIDMLYFYNTDRIQVDDDFAGEPNPVAVSNFPATQPVSIATMPTTPVTGTFFQSTQPVSIATMPTTPVTGTFFQTTQPISGTVTANQGTAGPVTAPWPVSLTDGLKATYSATSAIAFASAATATDIFTITGSATKTVHVLRIGFSGTQTTAAALNVLLILRSTANSAGTSATATNVSLDSTNAAATAVVRNYTANPTVGTPVGTIRAVRAFIPTTALASATQYYEFDFGQFSEQALTLRGATQVLSLNLNSVTVAGGAWTCWVEWTEE